MNLYTKSADGGSAAEPLVIGERWKRPGSWSSDGRTFVFVEADPATGQDIWMLRQGEARPQPLLRTPFLEGGGLLSPDGRWLAYVSDESGRNQVYVRPFPGPGGKIPISTEAGAEPVWSRSGRELFYRNDDKLLAVTLRDAPGLVPGEPSIVLQGPYVRSLGPYPNYDVGPDDQRFLLVKAAQASRVPQIQIVLRWFRELAGAATTTR